MLIVFPVANTEIDRADDLLDWMFELGGLQGLRQHKLLVVAAHPVPTDAIHRLVANAKRAFQAVDAIRQHAPEEGGWPQHANAMFRTAVMYLRNRSPEPFMWFETDCVPMKPAWADVLEREYQARGKLFMGALYGTPMAHLNGTMIYPPNLMGVNPWMVNAINRPFDLTRPEINLRRGEITRLICRSLEDPGTNRPHTFPDQASLSIVPSECVVFHGCKDGTLIARLREQRAPVAPSIVPVEEKTGPIDNIRKQGMRVIERIKARMNRLKLPGVTIWAASWSEDSEMLRRTLRVLRYCHRVIACESIVLFSYQKVLVPDFPCAIIPIPKLDWQAWSVFVNREVPKHITSDFAMSVHEDGFPIDLDLWNPEFLNCDYIGAPWAPDGVVGNGGFNIESKWLLKTKMDLPVDAYELTTASDMVLCRNRRSVLEQKGIKFAPRDLALTFSTETFGNQWPSFGFHGRSYATEKYKVGWQLIESLE